MIKFKDWSILNEIDNSRVRMLKDQWINSGGEKLKYLETFIEYLRDETSVFINIRDYKFQTSDIINKETLINELVDLLNSAQKGVKSDKQPLTIEDFTKIQVILNNQQFPITDLTKGCVKPGGNVMTTTTAFKEVAVGCMIFHNIKNVSNTDMKGYQAALDIIRKELQTTKNVFTSRTKGVLEEIDMVYDKFNPNFLRTINNAIDTAVLIRSNCPKDPIVENSDLFGRCRALASSILFGNTGIGDKWCPGDIYLINAGQLRMIEGKVAILEKRLNNANDTTDKMAILNDLNVLFGKGDDKIYAVSLKEGVGMLGKSKSVLDPLDDSNYNLTPEELEMYKTINDEQQNSEQLETAIENLRDSIKMLCGGSPANAVGIFTRDNRNHKNAKEKINLEINNSTIDDIKDLNSNSGFKLLRGQVEYHLNTKSNKATNAERKYKYGSLKLLLYVLCTYREYYSPFEHITNYSQGLGANPTFWKYYGEDKRINITEYTSGMSVQLISNIKIHDEKSNNGVYATYLMMLNDEKVNVKCSFRTNGGVQLTIELNKIK